MSTTIIVGIALGVAITWAIIMAIEGTPWWMN